jgi:perosamine synthetase
MKPIVMAGPWITEHEIKTVEDAMRTGWYEKPYYYVETFQKEFAKYHDRKYALMTPNCTTALHLLLLGLGIGKGDEVLVPDCTWVGSTACISYVGATPVFCDIEADSWCIDPLSVRENITPKTKAIIVVDLYGNMPKMDELIKIADDHGIYLIEDAAEAVGSTYKGVRAGKFGVGSSFSFHRTKTICTGEGGMLLIDDDKLYERCSMLRDHGRKKDGPLYYNFEVTPKYMPFNVQAAMGYAQFQRIDELVKKKHWIYEMYKERLASVPDIQLNEEPEHIYNGVWITAVIFGKSHKLNKADAMAKLQKEGVPSRPFFYPLSFLPAYGSMEDIYKSKNPVGYDLSSRGINLSCAMNLEEDQIDFICNGIKKILRTK